MSIIANDALRSKQLVAELSAENFAGLLAAEKIFIRVGPPGNSIDINVHQQLFSTYFAYIDRVIGGVFGAQPTNVVTLELEWPVVVWTLVDTIYLRKLSINLAENFPAALSDQQLRTTSSDPPESALHVFFEVIRLGDYLLMNSGDVAVAMTAKIKGALTPVNSRGGLGGRQIDIVFDIQAAKSEYDDLKHFIAKICARKLCAIRFVEQARARGRSARRVPPFSFQRAYDRYDEFRSLVIDYALDIAASTYRQGASFDLFAKDLITHEAFRVFKD